MSIGGPSKLARAGVLPDHLKPMLAASASEPFDAEDHIFEALWDGVRAIALIDQGRVRLLSRSQKDITGPFSDVAAELGSAVQADGLVLDGELVSLDREGVPRLPQVTQRLLDQGSLTERFPVSYEVFDILYRDYRPVLREPLLHRKRLLRQGLMPNASIHIPHFVEGEGINFFQAAMELGLEGMVAKRRDGAYRPGQRTRSWLKVRSGRAGNLVVGGYTIGGGHRKDPFGSVLLGAYEGGALRFVGSVGGGFSREDMALLHSLLTGLHADVSPFLELPQVQRLLYWCEPSLVIRVKYGELTEAGQLRFPIFTGIRPDIAPRECTLAALRGKT